MTHKILVVDDEQDWETIIREKFRKQIQQKEWELFFACNGLDALEILKKDPGIKVVILDYMMPKMDGLTLLNKLNGTNNLTIKLIMVTAFGDTGNYRKAMNEGAFDFLTKPIDFKDLESTINKALKQVDTIRGALKSRDELTALNRDLEIAVNIQKSMLPDKFPPFPQQKEFDIFAKMISAKKIGGDFYDFFFVDEYRVAIAIGDVSGKGIPAALIMARTCIHLKSTALQCINPEECLRKLNKILILEKERGETFSVTLFYGVLNIATGMMQYAYAGHPAPLIVHGDGKIEPIPQESPKARPLAYFDDSEYEVEKIQLKKGDTLIGYTDGLTDAENPAKIQFNPDENQLKKFFEGANNMSLQEIVESSFTKIHEFTAGAPQADDMTILALRYNGRSTES